MDYSGLHNLQVKKGNAVKKGDYIANTVRIPHGENHLHIGISINGVQECLLKYMDDEFLEVTKKLFSKADYKSQTSAQCLCDCETVVQSWN